MKNTINYTSTYTKYGAKTHNNKVRHTLTCHTNVGYVARQPDHRWQEHHTITYSTQHCIHSPLSEILQEKA